MQARDPSDNVLTTRQVSDLIEELVGKRPTSDQIREWCRQGYVAPEELPPIHLEHVRNRMGHYEITEDSVRRFVEMRRRRENNLLAFVKWCRQRSAELQSKGHTESAATLPESADEGDDEPAPESTNDSMTTVAANAIDPDESDSRRLQEPGTSTTPSDDESPRPPDRVSETGSEPIVAQSIPAEAADAFEEELLDQLVVDETDEDVEGDFFSTFIEDEQGGSDSDPLNPVDDDSESAEQDSTDRGGLSAIMVAADDSPGIKSPESDPPQPELFNAEPLKDGFPGADRSAEPVDDFGSFDEQPSEKAPKNRERRGFRSRRPSRSNRPSQHSRTNHGEPATTALHDAPQVDPSEVDPFSLGIFDAADEPLKPKSAVERKGEENVTDNNVTDNVALMIDVAAEDHPNLAAPVAERSPATEKSSVIESFNSGEPVVDPTTSDSESAPKPTPPDPVVPTLSLPPIKPLPPNSPLLPNFGAPRVSSPLRPEMQNQKPIAKQPQNHAAKAHLPRQTNAPSARRVNSTHSAPLDQLAAAYAAFASGDAPAVVAPSVEPESRGPDKSPAKPSPKPDVPVKPAARRAIDQKPRPLNHATDLHEMEATPAIRETRNLHTPSPLTDNEPETKPPAPANSNRPLVAAQVSRYLWLWVAAIAIGWACFGVSFVIKDDFGVIALTSIAVAATGMSGLWWTGK